MEDFVNVVAPRDTTMFMAFENGISFHLVPPILFENGAMAYVANAFIHELSPKLLNPTLANTF